jgi:hypothetical protein
MGDIFIALQTFGPTHMSGKSLSPHLHFISPLHLHIFRHNYYKFEEHVHVNASIQIKNLKCTCVEHAQKQCLKLNGCTPWSSSQRA